VTAYEEGRIAHLNGKSIRECPYLDSRSRWAWIEGWYHEQREPQEAIKTWRRRAIVSGTTLQSDRGQKRVWR
jgi:ribosome modulation factor